MHDSVFKQPEIYDLCEMIHNFFSSIDPIILFVGTEPKGHLLPIMMGNYSIDEQREWADRLLKQEIDAVKTRVSQDVIAYLKTTRHASAVAEIASYDLEPNFAHPHNYNNIPYTTILQCRITEAGIKLNEEELHRVTEIFNIDRAIHKYTGETCKALLKAAFKASQSKEKDPNENPSQQPKSP